MLISNIGIVLGGQKYAASVVPKIPKKTLYFLITTMLTTKTKKEIKVTKIRNC